ncbi:MAG: class I SAM-dependent methyltransferase [Cyclobacteriaceae bacterium]|nr:class I SAM-dependent methyltransferase [Cyclobacteriaceae bacterium]
MEKIFCKICRNEQTSKDTFVVREMMFGFRDEFNYFQCKNCACLQIENFPSNISKYYPSDYYSLGNYDGKRFKGIQGKLYKLRNRASLFRNNLFLRILHFLSPIEKYEVFQGLGVTKHTKILDVGCGNGDFFIYPFKELGFENVSGCDPYIAMDIVYPNNLVIHKTDIFGIQGKWDLIIYNHSFEHLPNPIENLKKVKELLSPTGICLLRTPIVPSFAWDKYGINWFQLDAPRHFFIHSAKSMNEICELTRLAIEDIVYDSTLYQFIASEGYQKDIPLVEQKRKKNFAEKTRRLNFEKLAEELNASKEGDQVAFVLRNLQ